jgi:type VI secretion system protein ImpA
VRDLLEKIEAMVSRYAGTPAEAEMAGGEAAGGGEAGEGGGGGGGGGFGGVRLGAPSVNREDVLRELERIAAHFRKTEPQSPLAYTLDEAVRRSRMTWPELIAEIVQDQTTRDGILSQLGIKPPPAESSY